MLVKMKIVKRSEAKQENILRHRCIITLSGLLGTHATHKPNRLIFHHVGLLSACCTDPPAYPSPRLRWHPKHFHPPWIHPAAEIPVNPAAVAAAAAVGRILPLGMRLHRPRLLIMLMHVPVLLLALQQRRLPRLPRRLHHHPIDWQYQTVLP